MCERVDETDAAAYVETSAGNLVGELRDLEAIVGAVYEGRTWWRIWVSVAWRTPRTRVSGT